MNVSRGQINAMSDIMAKLNAIGTEPEPVRTHVQENFIATPPAARITPSGSGVSNASLTEMSNIMARFRAATEGVREDAQTNDMLLEALQTERTDTGVRIAEWQITINESDQGPGKFYDVTRDDIKIATDLRLYEAAHMLCRELNKGSSITSPKIRKVLALEAQYASAFEDAIRYANAMKTTTGMKQEITRTKLSEAKNKALAAKDQLKEIR